MRVLVVYAHYNPDSFTHALPEQLTRGLGTGPDLRMNDLRESGFAPLIKLEDSGACDRPFQPTPGPDGDHAQR